MRSGHPTLAYVHCTDLTRGNVSVFAERAATFFYYKKGRGYDMGNNAKNNQAHASCKLCGAPLRARRHHGRCDECRQKINHDNNRVNQNRHSYVNNHDELAHVQEIRETCGLPPLKLAQRECLCCGESFQSWGASNRLCSNCSRRTEGLAGEGQKWPGQTVAGTRR